MSSNSNPVTPAGMLARSNFEKNIILLLENRLQKIFFQKKTIIPKVVPR